MDSKHENFQAIQQGEIDYVLVQRLHVLCHLDKKWIDEVLGAR